jgi:hypothetical protein
MSRRIRASEPGPPIRGAGLLQPRTEPNFLEEESSYLVRCAVFALARQRAALSPVIWPSALCVVAAAYLRCGKAGIAIQLYGATQAQSTRSGPEVPFRDFVEQRLEYFRGKALDDPALSEQWHAGERMSLDEVAGMLEADHATEDGGLLTGVK